MELRKRKEGKKGRRKRLMVFVGDVDDDDEESGVNSKKAKVDESAAPEYLKRTLIDIVAMEATEEDIEQNFFKYEAGEAGEINIYGVVSGKWWIKVSMMLWKGRPINGVHLWVMQSCSAGSRTQSRCAMTEVS